MWNALAVVVALAAAAQEPRESDRLRAGEVREIRFEEGELSRSFFVDAPASSPTNLIAWATSDDCRPSLRVASTAGDSLAEDDGTCDAHCSCARALLLEAIPLVLTLSIEHAPAVVRLQLAFAPESEHSVALAAKSPALCAEARAAREQSEFERSTQLVRDELARVFTQLDEVGSWNVAECLPPLTYLAYLQGDLELALTASERSLAMRRRYLPRGHALFRAALTNHGLALGALGRSRESLAAFEESAAECERSLPPDGPALAAARLEVAKAWHSIGELGRAVQFARLVLDTLGEGDPEQQRLRELARARLAEYAMASGDLTTARALNERALADAEEHGDRWAIAYQQANLGWLLWQLGDAGGARPLQEAALRTLLAARDADEFEVQRVRVLLAMTLDELGEKDAALALEEEAYAVMSEKLPPDQPRLLAVRSNLAVSRLRRGQVAEGIELLEGSVSLLEGAVSEDNALLLGARRALALGLTCVGEWARAKELLADVDRIRAESLPADNTLREATRTSLLGVELHGEDRAEVVALIQSLMQARSESLAKAARVFAPREVATLNSMNGDTLDWSLSYGAGYGAFPPNSDVDAEVFTAIETTRSAEFASARVLRGAEGDSQLLALREQARAAAQDVARLAESGDAEQLARAVRDRDRTQRELIEKLGTHGDAAGVRPTPAGIGAKLSSKRAAIAFWRYDRARSSNVLEPLVTESFVAFVVRANGALRRFELGPASEIEAAVGAWRAALLARDTKADDVQRAGLALRALVLDPLAPALADVKRIDVALDDVLHAVTLDALPRERGFVGDELEVRVHAALSELLVENPAAGAARELVVFGGIDFGSTAGRFAPLPGSADEARAIVALFTAQDGCAELARLVLGSSASRESLEQLAPSAQFLHIATHGFYASDSDASAGTRSGADSERTRFDEQVRGLSPMSLCGLAFAGANAAADAYGARPGVLTAEELATLDLTGCELAVLSACDTNAGVRRAGQGVQSLQKALHMAGARTVVTSLWRVSDSATRELMASFYRHVWLEHLPPARALWAAKRELRERRAPLRDWAGWVLSGE